MLIVELGFYQFVVKPIYEPLTLYSGYYFRALQPKKKRKLYNMKQDCNKIDIEASDEEEERKDTLAAHKFLKMVDTDPWKEE